MRISDWSSDVCSSDLWAWKRDYVCHRFTPANDCGDLEANGSCSFLRTECLDEERDGACKVEERVYRCPTPGSAVTDAPQYICGDDVYCINGDCEPIVREASTEFKDALVALHSIRSEEHTSELQSLMRISYAVFFLKKKNIKH